MEKKRKRKNMLQWGVLTLFIGMVLVSTVPTITQNFLKGFMVILGLVFMVFGISELVNYYKLGKVDDV